MGIIMMVGIAVSYGNILIDHINALVKEGMPIAQAIVEGANDRFRPVLMTAATTIFGLLPTVMAIGKGTEANVYLAIAVIGGTFMVTILTLFVVSVLYGMMVRE